jgi:hypothetical protein
MLEKIYLKEEFFLDVPSEISTTGMKPGRGVYIRCYCGTSHHGIGVIWLDGKGREIENLDWVDILEELYENL